MLVVQVGTLSQAFDFLDKAPPEHQSEARIDALAEAAFPEELLMAMNLGHRYAALAALEAWADAGRPEPPRFMNGFWYSLADDAEAKLKQYVVEYLKVAGVELAQALANTMVTHDDSAVLAAIDTYEDAGCEELYFVPGTLELTEIERLVALLDKRGR